MKKIFLYIAITLGLLSCNHKDSLWQEVVEDLDERVETLEVLCAEMNTNITSLQTIVDVLQSNDFITSIVEIKKDGKVVGYTITFGKHDPITIYHGQDGENGQNGQNGADGKDGSTPVIGVAQDTDGVYYWTLNGEWLLDDNGNKLPVSGKDGQNGTNGSNGQDGADGKDGQDGEDGKDGVDGQDGKDGKDGITPQLKIEDGYWYISYDNGATWTQLGKATGENGQDGKDGADGEDGKDGQNGADGKDGQNGADGKDGQDGDSMFQSVTQDENYVYFTLADGTVIKIAKGNGNSQPNGDDYIDFKDLAVKSRLIEQYDFNEDGEISYNEAKSVSGRLVLYHPGWTDPIDFYSFKEFKYFTNVTSCYIGANSLFEIEFPDGLDSIISCNAHITSLKLPTGCKYIGDKAFCIMKNDDVGNPEIGNTCSIKNIVWNDSIEYIGAWAFGDNVYNFSSLPNSIKFVKNRGITIKSKAFTFPKYFTGETNGICVSADTIYWNTNHFIGSYSNVPTTSWIYCGLGWVSLSHVETYNKKIKKVIFGSEVQTIPDYLCSCLDSLTEANIPDNVQTIGSRAYYNSRYLTTVTIGSGILEIKSEAFYYQYSPSLKVYCKATTPPIIGQNAFSPNVTIYVPKSSVEDYRAFWSAYASKIVGYDFE